MFHPWIFATPEVAPAPVRAVRFPLKAMVQVFLRFEAWQLRWTLPAVNISETGLRCFFQVNDEASARQAIDLESMVQAEPVARLQIDHDFPDLFAPVVFANLIQCVREPKGLALAFEFADKDPHLFSLVDQLSNEIH